jgi:hypothetical protein
MLNLKSRIACLETASMPSGPVLIYQGDTPSEREETAELAARTRGVVIVVSPLDFAL